MRGDHTWVTGGDTQISCGGYIGSGGSGDVYEVLFRLPMLLTSRWFLISMERFVSPRSIPTTC